MATLQAPCKINLSFKILSKREDGFHEVDTLMAKVDLYDILEIKPLKTKLSFSCNNPQLPTDENNLVIKAVQVFEKAYGKPVKAKIQLTKNIPHGAGLGGGSSDAASTLIGLNEMLGNPFTVEQLIPMAAELGSDVPFFLFNEPCRCTGRGEIITPEQSLATWSSPIILIKPNFSVSTPDAYKRWATSTPLKNIPYAAKEYKGITFFNDLERPVFEKFIILAQLKHFLHKQPEVKVAMLSGSGSALFALCSTHEEALKLQTTLLETYSQQLWTWVGTVNAQAPGQDETPQG